MTCQIEPNLQNKLFDHRACTLGFVNNNRSKFTAKRIDNKILSHDITDFIVYSACAEAYSIHADNDALPIPEQRAVLRQIGQFKTLLREAGPPDILHDGMYLSDADRNDRDRRDELLRRAELCKDDIGLPRLQAMPLVPDPDIFFETLIGMIKNDLISYQIFDAKKLSEKIVKAKTKICELKSNDDNNTDELFSYEKKLDEIMDKIMRAELEHHSFFEILNAEKITPHFVKMTKIGKGSESLSNIKDDLGNDFINDNLRKDHIKKFY
jgi:hypothetical protein